MDGRSHRRPECRLEGQGIVDDLLDKDDVPPRDRQRDVAQGRALPAASRSARAVTSARATATKRAEGLLPHDSRYYFRARAAIAAAAAARRSANFGTHATD